MCVGLEYQSKLMHGTKRKETFNQQFQDSGFSVQKRQKT